MLVGLCIVAKMVEGLDMTLEDLIEKNKKTKRLQEGDPGGRGSSPDSHRSSDLRSRAPRSKRSSMYQVQWCPVPYFMPPPPPHPPVPYFMPPPPPPPPTELKMKEMAVGSKLYVSNLHYAVTEDDLKVLFSEVGSLKQCAIHYDVSGRSEGTAEVDFEHNVDALKALRQYNNLRLDGMPLKIEFVGVDVNTSPYPPAPKGIAGITRACGMHAPPCPWKTAKAYMGPYGTYSLPPTKDFIRNKTHAYGDPKGSQTPYSIRSGHLSDWNQRKNYERKEGSNMVQGHECPQKRVRNARVSAEALDADLDKYLQEAKKIGS